MATVVDIPNVGVVEFPDGMSQDDVARESETLYSRFARNQPPPKYEGMLAGPPGFEQPTRSPEEWAARNTRSRQELGIPEGETPRTFGQIVTEPLVKLPRVTPQMAQDAWSFISAWGAAGEGWISPETAQEIAGAQSEKPGTAAKVTAGLVNAAESVPETFTSPLGIATLGAGTLGATGARLVSAGFAVDMLANTPHAVQAWRDSLKTGDAALISEASAGLALHGLMTFAAGRHAVTSPKTIKAKQLADAIRVSEAEADRLMETPEWQAAVERAAASGAKPVERLAPQTAEAMREMGPFKGEFVETGPRAVAEPPVVPPVRETIVPNVQTELETKPTELQPASPELKGAEDAIQERIPEALPVEVPPVSGEAVGAQVREPERPTLPREEAERPAPEAPAKVNKRQVHSEFSAALESLDDQAKLDILSEMGYDINPDNERLYMVDRDNRKLYLTGDQLVEAKQEFVRLAKERQAAPEAPKPEVTKAETAPVAKVQPASPAPAKAVSSADTPTKKLKAQKAYLVQAVQQAIKEAPEDFPEGISTPTSPDKAAFDALEKAREAVRVKHTGQSQEEWEAEWQSHYAEWEPRYEPLFQKYGITKEVPKHEGYKTIEGATEIMREGGTSTFDSRVSELLDTLRKKHTSELPHIVIEVPGDGTFHILNTKRALRDFLEVTQRFPSGPPKQAGPRLPSVAAKPIPEVSRKVAEEDALKAAEVHVSSDPSRFVLQHTYSDGRELVATDGRRMIRIIGDFGGSATEPLIRKAGEAVTATWEGNRFPNFAQVIPAQTFIIKAGADTAELTRLIRLAQFATSERAMSVTLYRNKDGTLGIRSSDPDFGEYNGNIKEGAEPVGAYNPQYLLEAMDSARRLGNERVDLYASSKESPETNPLVIRGKNHEEVLMPMRFGETTGAEAGETSPAVRMAAKDIPIFKNKLPAPLPIPEPKPAPTKGKRKAKAPKPEIVGMGGAVPEELPPPTPQATISRLKAKEAAKMEAKVKLPVEYDLERLNEQFDIFTSEIGDALTTGGQFLAKKRRPAVAKGAPAEPATVTSKEVNQYFTSKLVTLVNEIRRIKSDLAQQASPEHEQYLDLLLERAKNTFRQVQELRRASHESLAFWNKIKAEMIDMQQALGVIGDIKRRLPILDQLWKDTRERQFRRAGKDLLEFARVNLFTLGSWTLDFATNLAVAATKLPAFAMGDMISLARGNSAHRMASALRAAWRSAKNLVPGERFRLAKEIESRLGTVAGAEFQGYGKEVMADFSEILKDKPAAAEQLKKLDIVLAAPVRMKRATDNFFGRLGASTELYHQAYEAGHKAGLRGDDLQTFVDNFFQTPPREAIDAAVKEGKEWKFNRDLTEWEEKFASNTITKLAIEAYPRWTLQFVRWAGEMLGLNPSLYLKIKQGRATQQEVIDGLVKAATGWGGIVAFNQLVYDNIDANTMEYVKEDGDRVRLSGRTPAPELFFITALLRGDWQKAKAALSQTSLPLAKLLGGEPGGIISPVVDTMRESVRGKYTAERTTSELSKLLNNAIPGKSVLGFFRALYDPTIREGLGAPIPGVAGLLPQKIEPTTGEPAAPMQRIPGTKFTFPTVGGTPFPGAVRDLNAIQAVLMNHGLAVTRPRRTSIIELPPEDVPKAQRREYEKIAGQNVRRIVGDAITNPDFWKSPAEIRRKLLQAWMNEARAQARNAMAEKYGTSNKPVKSEPIPVGLLPDKFKPTK